MISTKMMFLGPIYGFFLFIGFVFLETNGSDIEERLFPMFADQAVLGTWRTGDQACWQWRYTKKRDARLVRSIFYVERVDGVRYPTDEIRPDLGIPPNNSTIAKAGVTRTIPKCVTIPATLRNTEHFSVHGAYVFRSLFWELDQPIPIVEFGEPDTHLRPEAVTQ